MKLAIVYDWMDKWGGVERLLLTLHEMFPHADWYTSSVDRDRAPWTKQLRVHTSFMQQLPVFIRRNRILSLPFYPYAFESFDFSSYDLVISVTSSFAKGVITRPHTKHVCILLTPTRWLWGQSQNYELRVTNYPLLKTIKQWYTNQLKTWDYVAASRPDRIISISRTVAQGCKHYYHRDSTVLYPPFDLEYWNAITPEDSHILHLPSHFYLVVSRLEPYKKVDLVIEAFNHMKDTQLVIVGKGTQKTRLKALAKDTVRFLEDLTDSELASLYAHAKAVIMPQEEDFGYVPLEALFFTCPVIAFGKGGATETVQDGVTGTFFDKQTSAAVQDAVERSARCSYNLEHRQRILQKFSKESFKKQLDIF